jgi:hypothetical protein
MKQAFALTQIADNIVGLDSAITVVANTIPKARRPRRGFCYAVFFLISFFRKMSR